MNFLQEMVGAVNPRASERAEREAEMKRQHQANLSATVVPFGSRSVQFAGDYRPDRSILEVVTDLEITAEQFRNSKQLKDLLNDIVSSVSLFHCWGRQSIKVRLNAFVKMLVSQLCVPHIMSLYGVGSTLFGSNENAQSEASLVKKGKRILTEAFTLFKLAEEAILDSGDDACLDERRFHLFIMLIEFKCSSFLSHGITIREFGGSALEALSCHILGVTAVTQCIQQSIKIVVTRLVNVLTGETTHSTITESKPQLQTLVLDYFAWLRDNYEQLVRMCRREEIITSVDPSIRAWLRGETYSSPVEIISVYNQKYRRSLTHMAIPLQPYRNRDIEQARKDLVRETVLMNSILYNAKGGNKEPALPSQQQHVCVMVRAELRKMLAYLFEIDVFQAPEDGGGDHLGDMTDNDTSNSSSFSSTRSMQAELSALKLAAHRTPKGTTRKAIGSPDARQRATSDGESTPSGAALESSQQEVSQKESKEPRERSASGPRVDASYWEYELLDALYSYTVLAASRTFAAGDAFLILNDLYGGEGLVFSPCATARSVATPREGQQLGKEHVDTNIAILASGVKVTLRERYNLFVAEEMQACSNRAQLKPLMRFECTTTTLLVLNQGGSTSVSETLAEKRAACGKLFQTVISNPEHICRRAVTIEPYL